MKVGARGLGIRVTEDESGDLVFSHGDVTVPDVMFVGAMTDVVRFAAENPEEVRERVNTGCCVVVVVVVVVATAAAAVVAAAVAVF